MVIINRVGSARRISGFAAMLLAAGLMAGCETARDPQLLASPYYSSGYGDGCLTAQTRINGFDDTVTRDGALSETQPAYDIGWRDGYQACGGFNMDASSTAGADIFERTSEHYQTAPR